MDKGYGQADPGLARYVDEVFGGDDPTLESVRERQRRAGLPDIQVGRLDGLHLEVIARVAGASKAVEIGTLGGYSGVCLLRGMAPDGILHTFEIEPRHVEVARDTFREAGVESRVRLHVGPAAERLRDIERDAPFDLVFIDADKPGYPIYLAWAAEHLRVGGVLLGDNAFLFGKVPQDPTGDDAASIRAMRSFNEALARGGRFRATMLPTGEGLAFGVKLK